MKLIIFCITLEFVLFVTWYIYCYSKCCRSSILFTTAEIYVPFIYLIYSIVAPLFFVIEGKSLCNRFFYISILTMQKSCLLYLLVLVFVLLLLFLDNNVKKIAKRPTNWVSDYRYAMPNVCWDFIALIIILYYVTRIISVGSIWNELDTLDKRGFISSEYVAYLNIYMVAYTNKMICTWIINRTERSLANTIRLTIPILFWGIYIYTTSRRYFLMVIPTVFLTIIAAENKDRISFKWILAGSGTMSALLIMGARRVFLSLTKASFVYYLHNSFAEFIYTYYTGCFFISNSYSLQYGKTYISDTLTQWIPRAIYLKKPLDLSIRFWNMAHTNVPYSFSPIAEGLYNFGWGAFLVVPFVIYLYIKLANYIFRFSSILYLTIVAGFVGFMRGNVSNCFLDFFMITIIMLLMNVHGHTYKIYVRKKNDIGFSFDERF